MSDAPRGRVLVLGYGNPGRLDDGLGPALADAIEALGLPLVDCLSCYELSVEHAEDVARHDAVIFADAALSGPAPFRFEPIDPDAAAACAFSTHALTPAGVLALARQVYGRTVPAYLLAIRGDEFDQFGERLSPRAQAHLQAARDELALRLTATLADELPEHRVGPRCCGLLVAG